MMMTEFPETIKQWNQGSTEYRDYVRVDIRKDYVLVPREPTEEMLWAPMIRPRVKMSDKRTQELYRDIYKVMIKASEGGDES